MKSHAAAAESADTRAAATNTAKSADTGAAATADSTANSAGMRAPGTVSAASAAAAASMPAATAATAAAATTPAAMTCRDFDALAKRGLVIEDAEGRQADVKDLLLTQNNSPRGVVRRCMRWRRVR
jgi:hypothetical protein